MKRETSPLGHAAGQSEGFEQARVMGAGKTLATYSKRPSLDEPPRV
jgi:hypothetical protein